jgi:hypothetical protein
MSGKWGWNEPIYIKKAEAYLDSWEGEWDRVQRRRKEGHPLMKGGRYREPEYDILFGKHATLGVPAPRRKHPKKFKKPPYASRN